MVNLRFVSAIGDVRPLTQLFCYRKRLLRSIQAPGVDAPGSRKRGRPPAMSDVDGLRWSESVEDHRGFGTEPWISPQALQFLRMQSRPAGINGAEVDTPRMNDRHQVIYLARLNPRDRVPIAQSGTDRVG